MRKRKKKYKTSNIILVVLAVFLLIFIVTMIVIYCYTGGIPDTLVSCVFALCGGEASVLGWIKTTKERQLDRIYQLLDRKGDQ